MAALLKDTSMSIALIEHDSSGDDLCVWTYPGVSASLQAACVNRVATDGQQCPYFFFKLKQDWVYVYSQPMLKDVVPDVTSSSICIITRIFNPEKNQILSRILFEQYKPTGDPTKILEGYLGIHTIGNFSNSVGSYDVASFKDTDAFLAASNLKELFEMLGVEFIVIWNAMLLKKRILVVGESTDSLLLTMRSLPQLVWHRKDFSILRPLIRAEPEHLDDLTSAGVFAAGTLDPSLSSRSDLYDVLLSIPERRVTVTNHALAEMKMCSVHRELAAMCHDAVEAGSSDLELLKVIAKKTATVLEQLRGLAAESGGKLSEEVINASVSQGAAQQWLVRLATAEGMM